jgi:hypothetical protein
MRPACQLFGTVNDTDWYAFCCQPVVCDGTALATFKSVNIYICGVPSVFAQETNDDSNTPRARW